MIKIKWLMIILCLSACVSTNAQGVLGIVGGDMSTFLNIMKSQGYAAYQLDYGTQTGAIIDFVQQGGGAHYAGLTQYDVIVSVNGRKINKFTDLKSALAQKKPGSTVQLVYYRQKVRYTTNVTLSYPASNNAYYLDWYGNYYTQSQIRNGYNQNDADFYPHAVIDDENMIVENTEKEKKFEKKTEIDKPVKIVVESDVDVKIPMGKAGKNADIYCVIIANEKYKEVAPVEFAEHDGQIFKEYCVKTLGIPEKHIRTYFNATFGEFAKAIDFLTKMSDVANGKAQLIFYYAGHGLPNEKDKSAYIIPVDGYPKVISTCYKLSDLYSQLGQLKSQSTTVLLDACFSGMKRGDGGAVVEARGVAIKPKKESLTGNMIVLSAASDDEMAHSYKEKGHGMFTYFLLKKLQESKGNTTWGDLYDYIAESVKRNSVLENDKQQTPSVISSPSLTNSWKQMKLK